MKRISSISSLILAFLFVLTSAGNSSFAQTSYNITPNGRTYLKIARMYAKQTQKAYDMAFSYVIEGAFYGGMLNQFKAGNTGVLRSDYKTAPKYVNRRTIKAEYQFQVKMAHELLNMGYTQENNPLLKTAISSLFNQYPVVWEGRNPGKSFFLNLQAGREALYRVRDRTVK